ncbi:MAG: protein kinase [Candidatus Eisenbacteria bacterium]|uniref:Protein kinase n=1 Tax=Eiseniibacteriota bacterium TaxID=2212470 RepID=A0A849SN67_UNCEI|nr:protein kinase [Candidatus Eisenbacteria bacterium]
MNPDDLRLEELTSRLMDGEAVDWDAAESELKRSDSTASVRALREVSRIAQFNRTLQRERGAIPARHAPPVASLEPARWGSLLLLERVGVGANGEVWRAWDPRLQREVALKFLQPKGAWPAADAAASPLLEEARALARVRHANVVAVHGIGDADGRVGMWMEFLGGTTLEKAIQRLGKLPVAEVIRIGRDLARALGAVHAAGLIHRDLKPANVVIERDARVVLTDFGLGQQVALAAADPVRDSGTPMFMAPERLDGDAATVRSDLYALGMTMWCALTGAHPFTATTLAELEVEARRGPARSLTALRSDVPASLARAIERAIAPSAESRFADAEAFAQALEAIDTSAVARPAVSRAPLGRWLAAAAVLVVLAGTWFVWQGRAGRQASVASTGTSQAPSLAAQNPAADAAIAAYDVEASFVRRGAEGDERLATGDRVGPGDRLSLEFRSTRAVHVYVLNEDERGESYLLFPQPLFDRGNPIPENAAVVLPGTVGGRENAWTVTSRGGREHFLVIASPKPVAEIEAELSKLPAPRAGHPIEYAAIAPATVERLRGVGGVAAMPRDSGPRRAGAFDRFAALAGREIGVRGVWVRSVTLTNPVR